MAALKKASKHLPENNLNDGMDDVPEHGTELRYAISLIRQGNHRFYTLTIPSNILSSCSFATTKDEDPALGFQRVLDPKRAADIANYINEGGSIPSSVVLSAQPEANFRSVDRSKTAAFNFTPHSFLIIDGQHRVFGYSKANVAIRVPVVIYDGLSKEEEARLFIDINTKQKPVPKELLLAIRSLARTESDIEAILGQVFDLFDQQQNSALKGKTSSTKKSANKIDRVTFSAGLRPHLPLFDGKEVSYIYNMWNEYFSAVLTGLRLNQVENSFALKTTLRAFCEIFPDVVQRVQDKYKSKYGVDNFYQVISPIFNLASTNFSKPSSILNLANDMKKKLRSGLAL